MPKRILRFLVILPSIFLSCFFDIPINLDESDMIGEWLYTRRECNESLVIRPDLTYMQYYRSADGSLDSNINDWNISYSKGKQSICFTDYIFMSSDCKPEMQISLSTSFLKSPLGRIKIHINSDYGLYYVKQWQ